MALLEIVQYPNKLLRRKGRYVTDINHPKVQRDITDMLETLQSCGDNCAALAATQLAINDPYDIVVINPLPDEPIFHKQPLVLVNPRLSSSGSTVKGLEGCMSISPDTIHAEVARASEVAVTALNRNGEPLAFTAKDFFARCLQHECDHLKGKLYIDYLTPKQQLEIERTIACAPHRI